MSVFKNSFKISCITVVTMMLMILTSDIQSANGMRPLGEYKKWLKELPVPVLLESLPRGPVSPSSSSPCTHIPGGKPTGHCTIEEMNFAGHVFPPPLVFPTHVKAA
ncbi:hypothetical protein POM88_014363 [Heracleum sosnowskyi]|uniref:Transmembrane protein n=1 Tax=Heracleum sosnowskyi TaxID=360622 RepID=A0AAD8J3J0_9APIA|nr:hypothetical protein POM88_014363 [Heracleum sosnowskyi]